MGSSGHKLACGPQKVAKVYEHILSKLGVDIRFQKSAVSTSGSAEFAKRFHLGLRVTRLSRLASSLEWIVLRSRQTSHLSSSTGVEKCDRGSFHYSYSRIIYLKGSVGIEDSFRHQSWTEAGGPIGLNRSWSTWVSCALKLTCLLNVWIGSKKSNYLQANGQRIMTEKKKKFLLYILLLAFRLAPFLAS